MSGGRCRWARTPTYLGRHSEWTVKRSILGLAGFRPTSSHSPGRTDWGGWHGDPDNKYYRKDFRRTKALLDDELDGEYHLIRGNHDRPLSVWQEFFPPNEYPPWFHFREDGARYVFLDSNPHQGYHQSPHADAEHRHGATAVDAGAFNGRRPGCPDVRLLPRSAG